MFVLYALIGMLFGGDQSDDIISVSVGKYYPLVMRLKYPNADILVRVTVDINEKRHSADVLIISSY